MASALHDSAEWTSLQGQYLAFIYAYTTIHNQAPAERDMQQFFHVTPPTVHNMFKLLEYHGFIRRQRWPHLFGQKSLGLKWDLADDGFCPFRYAALCMVGRSLK